MNTKRLITIAVAATILIGGVAAVGAASPIDQASDTAMDAHEENASGDVGDAPAEERGDNADAAGDNSKGVGPSDGLPEQVPDHVSQIHETIESYLDGSIDDLGESLNDVLADDDSADENDDNDADT